MSRNSPTGNDVIELPLRTVRMIRISRFCRRDPKDLRYRTDAVPLDRSKKASVPVPQKPVLPAPANLPFGEDQTSSSILSVFTLRIVDKGETVNPDRSTTARGRHLPRLACVGAFVSNAQALAAASVSTTEPYNNDSCATSCSISAKRTPIPIKRIFFPVRENASSSSKR